MQDLAFDVHQESDGGLVADCLGERIVTEGDTWEQFRDDVPKAGLGFFFDQPQNCQARIRLHPVRDEVLTCG